MSILGTRKSRINRRRKGKLAVLLPWLRRFGLMLLFLVFAFWAGAWFFLSDADTKTAGWMKQQTLKLTAHMGFRVENILLEGRIHANADVLKAVINIQKGDPLFSLNPQEAKALIERIQWVKSAHIERRLPDTIYIFLEERIPVALWKDKSGQVSLIDREGKVITKEGLEPFREMIVVSGAGAQEKALDLVLNLQAEPLIEERVRSATRIGGRRWDLKIDKDITVNLPEDDLGLVLRRFAMAQEEDKILDKDITNIDLREPDRMILRTRPGHVQEYKAGLKSGSDI